MSGTKASFPISVVAQDHVFFLFLRLKKKVQPAQTFSQSLANDGVK